jgi:2',3'-cyclic-nucleotide 2'-phosphodiesterase (5'-nucleotidase family)
VVKNLSIVAVVLIGLLAGLLIKDYMSLPSRNLIIFYTSNLRGQIKPFSGAIQDQQYRQIGGLAFIKGFIAETSKAFNFNPDEVLLLDTGDALFGTAEASLTMGDVPLRLMGKAGYDAMTIGNLDFEYGFDRLKNFISAGHVPMLACNYRDVTAPVGDTFQPGLIIDKGGVKVGIIGLGHGELARNTRQDNIVSLEIIDFRASVQKTAAQLKSAGAEVIVLLSHHPSVGSLDNPGEVFPDIDIIIGDLIGPGSVISGRPLVCQTAPSRGGGIGMVKVSYVGGEWDIARGFQRIFTVDAEKITPDAGLAAEISRIEAKIDGLLDEVITTSSGNFTNSYTEESTIGNLIADCMKDIAGTQIALTNSGGIKAAINEGPVTLRHLYDMLPFENTLVAIDMAGWQIENLIEEGLTGKTGFLQASGLSCTYSSSNPPGFRLIQIYVGDEPLEYNRTYSLAVNDFMYSNQHDWPELNLGKNPQVRGLIREGLETWLRKVKSVAPDVEKRYTDATDIDETLQIQALSHVQASLTQPVEHDGTCNSEYSRLLAEIIRLETGADFAFIPASLVSKTREPLSSLTPARIVSDFSTAEGVKIAEITGAQLEKLVRTAVGSESAMAFSGLSLEMLDNGNIKIIPWGGNFLPENVYRIAVNENFPDRVDGQYDVTDVEKVKVFNDIRRVFLNGLRARNGQVELKRALY